MLEFEAGFGCMEITPHNLGLPLMGYGTREHGTRLGVAEGVHDSLWARAVVLRQGNAAWVLCAVDLVGLDEQSVFDIRQQVSQSTGLAPETILVAAIHNHSGPSAKDAGNWNKPFASLVAEAIVRAWENLQPARLASGAGVLYGYSINRRWFERPIDPGVGVLRLDDEKGNVLGTVVNFGLHAVVLGGDNLQISADYVGYARDAVEQAVGGVCVFTNGGAGDVNPITETVRQQRAEGRYFTTMTGAHYYGQGPDAVFIEERKGGTFREAEILGHALAEEVIRVARGLVAGPLLVSPWSVQTWVNHLEKDKEEEFIETQALGVGDFALVAQPGEIFVDSALAIKAGLRGLGFSFPWVVSYANGYQSYLAPSDAHREGGYEAERAESRGHSPDLQSRLWLGIEPLLPRA